VESPHKQTNKQTNKQQQQQKQTQGEIWLIGTPIQKCSQYASACTSKSASLRWNLHLQERPGCGHLKVVDHLPRQHCAPRSIYLQWVANYILMWPFQKINHHYRTSIRYSLLRSITVIFTSLQTKCLLFRQHSEMFTSETH